MYGAIIGDLAGSIYEFEQTKNIKNISTDIIIPKNGFYSDDTILTIAILDAILNKKDEYIDYDKYLRDYINKYRDYHPDFSPYFPNPFSPGLMEWAKKEGVVGESKGNGAMMRISSVGYLFNTETEVVENAKLATSPSHNSEEAINCATTIAQIIFYFRQGMSKEWVFNKLNLTSTYTPFTSFNYTCSKTIGNCLYALYNSTSFEDAILKTLYLGGDTDTNAAIVGSMAEALYGIPKELKQQAEEILLKKEESKELLMVLKKANYYN